MTNKSEAAFWIVWSPTGIRPPKRRHASYRIAVTEAERLARENPGSEFIVLEAMAARQVCTMVETVFDGNANEIPF